ncbi:amino acid ABC transporter permease [Actinomadura kijaniata]|uniref:Glutamate transport system permease protein n=1 Tax=Actinomadura namibiensis TaxID=182080 RepID=A0A7W3QJR1_ACTNM|nr:amino acid ABC transporter permease [Actinomadura namibiensis]MBA8949660.1 glutamate transport system permease protein [Actinomadura namibiensis]
MSAEASVLFDAPGPRAQRRNLILTVVSAAVLVAVLAVMGWQLKSKGQFAANLWEPFLKPEVWTGYILKGLANTLKAALVGSVLALVFGAVFGLARLSDHAWLRVPAGAVVEFFRAMPLLILIFLAFFVPPSISPIIADGPLGNFQRVMVETLGAPFGVEISRGVVTVPAFAALVFGLVLYNGSVLAEVIRAGVQSIPRGQSEAAYSIGMRKNQVMRMILLPQAITVMMPAIVSQMVVLLKDTALGFIIAFEDLTSYGFKILPANYFNLLPAAFVISIIYIGLNMVLSGLATKLEARTRRSAKVAAGTPSAAGMTATGRITGDGGAVGAGGDGGTAGG